MQAKGRLQCWNADGQELGGSCREGCAGKGQAATLEQQRLTARLGGSCRAHLKARAEGLAQVKPAQAPSRVWCPHGRQRTGPAVFIRSMT